MKKISFMLKPLKTVPACSSFYSTNVSSLLEENVEKSFDSGLVVNRIKFSGCSKLWRNCAISRRFYQHTYRIRKGNSSHSSFCHHSLGESHLFDCQNWTIVHRCQQTRKTKILKSLYINQDVKSINTWTTVLKTVASYKCIF